MAWKKLVDFEHPTPWGKLAPKIYTTWGNHPPHICASLRGLANSCATKYKKIIAHTILA